MKRGRSITADARGSESAGWSAALFLLCLLAALIAPGASAADWLPPPPPPDVDSKAHVLIDFSTGIVLAEKNADARLQPASLTKLMTAYVVFGELAAGRLSPDQQVKISAKAWRMRGSRMFIEVNTLVTVDDLVHGMIIQSGNDASVALAEHIAGSEEAFVEIMNARAAELGMSRTSFRNSTGLPARGHVSTARDLGMLARALIADYPQFRSLYSQPEFSYNGIRQYNRNRLLRRDPSVDGLKTGYTVAAGYCLVGTASRSGMRVISVLLGAQSSKARNDGSQALLDYGFEHYETHRLYAKGQPLGFARVWKGVPGQVSLGLAEDLYVTIPRGRYDALTAAMDIEGRLVAPIGQYDPVGAVRVMLQGERLLAVPLVVLDKIAVAGPWTRFKHDLLRRFDP